MSGVETIAAVGLVSNVLQFAEFTAKLCCRIREYSSALGLPSKPVEQFDRLSDILDILNSLDKASGAVSPDGSILQRCQNQAEMLPTQLERLKGDGQSGLGNFKVALRSLRRDKQLQEVQRASDGLINTLSLQLQVEARSTFKTLQENTTSVIKRQSEHSVQLADLSRVSQLNLQDNDSVTTLTKPVWMVPIGRNPDFVGRETIMAALSSRLAPRADIVPSAVLCGLGGVGKS